MARLMELWLVFWLSEKGLLVEDVDVVHVAPVLAERLLAALWDPKPSQLEALKELSPGAELQLTVGRRVAGVIQMALWRACTLSVSVLRA